MGSKLPRETTHPSLGSMTKRSPKPHADRYTLAKRQLLHCLRGDEKQEDVSRRLGFRFNQYGKWESGFKQMKWKEFLFVCARFERDIKTALRDLGLASDGQSLSAKLIVRALLKKNGLDLNQESAEKLGIGKTLLKRLVKGDAEPSLEFIFKLFDFTPGYLAFFTTRILDGEELEIFAKEIKELRAVDSLLAENPQLVILIGALHLKQNQQNSPLFIEALSKSMGSSVKECEKYLSLAMKNGLIEFKNQTYQLKPISSTQMLFASQDHGIRYLRSLARLGDSRTDPETGHFKNSTGNPNYFFSGLYSLSKEQSQQIAEILMEAAGKIEAVCAKKTTHSPPTDLRLVHFNYFDLRDLKN